MTERKRRRWFDAEFYSEPHPLLRLLHRGNGRALQIHKGMDALRLRLSGRTQLIWTGMDALRLPLTADCSLEIAERHRRGRRQCRLR